MDHQQLRSFSATLVWSFLAHRGFVQAYTGRASLILDAALALLGGLVAYLCFPGALE